MKTRNIGLIISGSLILIIGLGHMFFPVWGYSTVVQAYFKPSPLIADHFYYLATYAICAFLLFIGSITIYVGASTSLTQHNAPFVYYYSLLSVIVWTCRLLLELRYPVRLSLFGISNPGTGLPVVLSCIIAGFISGMFIAAKNDRK